MTLSVWAGARLFDPASAENAARAGVFAPRLPSEQVAERQPESAEYTGLESLPPRVLRTKPSAAPTVRRGLISEGIRHRRGSSRSAMIPNLNLEGVP